MAAKHPDLVKELAAASRVIDAGAPAIPLRPNFLLRGGGRFQRADPLEGFPEERGAHVIDRADE